MFGPLKNLLRKLAKTPDQSQAEPPPSAAPAPKRPIVMAPRGAPMPPTGSAVHQNGKGIELPLQSILSGLPLELQPQVKHTDAGMLTISVPLEKILAQLSRGIVRIPFGELRLAAPELFRTEPERDQVMVPLPLGEILPRLNPALITRRRVQKRVEVPAEISSPFDPRHQGLIFSIGPAKAESAPVSPLPARQAAIPAPAPAAPQVRSGITSVPTPTAPASPPRSPITPAPAPQPPAVIPFSAPVTSAAPRPPREVSPTRPPAPVAPAPVAPRSSGNPNPLLVNLTSLAEGWPEAVRQELVQLGLVDAKVGLPAEMVERALKQGRVAFTWKTLRSWIVPLPLPVVSAHDTLVLELPLKVVAPLFLGRQKEAAAPHQKIVVDEDIPNLFFGFPQPESASGASPLAASAATARPADTNFYVWDDTSDRARIQEDEVIRGPTPGTRFVAKYATPNEVVSRAAALDGVAGSLIALPDGLMVASRLPAELNGDTVAAFLPQIFGKVSQCTKELRMGELNNVNFTVGHVPWKIFRVNAIFFAAFGRAGEPLPTAQLASLAGELDHTPK